jgi:REP element-mobilizing transposase RayT
MPRKPRIEFEGAVYHVFNHGHERTDLFATAEAARAFCAGLDEAAGRMHWRIHAWCLTRNQYHLALETPRGNLANGVHWLQSAFGNRFHRFRAGTGRAFRSRYRAILIEPGATLAGLVDGIHLLPVRAGLVGPDLLPRFRWSSYRAFAGSPAGRPSWLTADWLAALGGLADTPEGWHGYAAHLAGILADPGAGADGEFLRLCRGWAHGSEDYLRRRREDFGRGRDAGEWGGLELAARNRSEWEARLAAGARALHRELAGAGAEPKSAPWKVALAAWLKRHTSATNRWLTDRLHMGPPDAVSRYVGEAGEGLRPAAGEILSTLTATVGN